MANLILYFTVGYPDRVTFSDFVSSISGELVDYVEFGFPSSDPKYDGPVIRKTHSKSDYKGESDYADLFMDLHRKGIKLYSLAYVTDIIANFGNRIEFLRNNGFSGILMPDLLIDYFGDRNRLILAALNGGLEVIPFFNPSTPDRVIREVSSIANSWIYYGIQPSTGIVMPMDMEEVVSRIRSILPDREVNFGFGIRSTDQAAEIIRSGGDGIAIGSALVPMLENGDLKGFSEYVQNLRRIIDAN